MQRGAPLPRKSPPMELHTVLGHLEDLARKLGVQVVYQRLAAEEYSSEGGLCKVKGEYKIFLDRSYPIETRIQILARTLSSFERNHVYVLPLVREILERQRLSPE